VKIVVHGGAGEVSPERHARLRAGVRAAAEAGHAILDAGGAALDAVVAAVRVLEDDPEYNAGVGSAMTRDGTIETDASVMDGAMRRFGGVAAVPDLGCAVALARAVLDDGEHVLLAGPAAMKFAAECGIAPAPEGSLVAERQRSRLFEMAIKRGVKIAGGGTVGAVAHDRDGRFAAATSTGGIVWKRAGRVGDSPIPGAGTWADREIAISATGDGESILRVLLAHSVACRRAAGRDLRSAAIGALHELRDITGGGAGLIAIDANDRIGIQLTPTMSTAWICDGDRGDSMGERVQPTT
jgi:beta-aspartyl-peptidase (threonine type)